MKENEQEKLNDKELDLINKYSRSTLGEKDVYVFTLTLCDNEVDRDFERFSVAALNELAKLFEGKTGIFDHNAKSVLQSARVFKTWVELDKTKKTSTGEGYCALKAKAYMVRTRDNESLIAEIEAGIKKEVSVSCSVEKNICSICGKDLRLHSCEHIKGKAYGNTLCYGTLSEPTDAYEWSFVAVPAQRLAGVTKKFEKEGFSLQAAVETVKTSQAALNLSFEQVKSLREYIETLEKASSEVACFRDSLLFEIQKYARLILPEVDSKQFVVGCSAMDLRELQSLEKGLKNQMRQHFPVEPQLKSITQKTKADFTAFKI